MIFFDYGHTLLYEPNWDPTRGYEALLQYAATNAYGCTGADIQARAEAMNRDHIQPLCKLGYDVPAQVTDRVLYESLGISFSLTPSEVETVFWDAASPGAAMPGADQMLDLIRSKGIRSAVVSNCSRSGEALTRRLNRLLPRHRFEFVIASSDYLFRKPHPLLFELALHKAGLSAKEVWYCGDHPQKDVEGAAKAGIFPVWYDNDTEKDYKDRSKEMLPQCDCLHIHQWEELTEQFGASN